MAPVTTIASSEEYDQIRAFLREGILPSNINGKEKYAWKLRCLKFSVIDNELYFKDGTTRKKYIPPYNREQAREAARYHLVLLQLTKFNCNNILF